MIRMSSLRNVNSSSSNSKPKSKYSDFDLFNATEKGDVSKVADILENSTLSINDVKNAIHIAAKYDRIEVMKLFIEKNSREVINIIDNDMNTPLIIASFEGHHNMIKLLLNALASVNDQNILGITPLIAVLIPPVNNPKECLVQLLDRKADIHLRNSEGSTALLCSATYSDVDCFKLLLGRGANIKDVNSNGRNSMHLAVLNFSLDLLMYLVSEHSELAGHQDVDGHTPLHICCYIGYAAGLRILLSSDFYKLNKKNLEIKSNYGNSALFLACGRGNKGAVIALINSGAEIESSHTEGGITCALYASYNGHLDCLICLIDKGAKLSISNNGYVEFNVATLALGGREYGIVLHLLETYPYLIKEKVTEQEISLLGLASSYGSVEIVAYLLDHGESIEYKHKDSNGTPNSGHPPLTMACFSGNIDIVKYLVQRGADLENGDIDSTNPLMAAAYSGHVEIIRYLLDKGCDIDHKETNGLSALSAAIDKGHMECVNLLLERGLKPERGRFDDYLYQHPDYLFTNAVLLTLCKSPMSILNKLTNQSKEGEESKSIDEILRQLLESNDPNTVMRIVTYLHSLNAAAKINPLEEEDLVEKIKATENLLNEVFKSPALDAMDHVLQLILPIISFREFDKYDVEALKANMNYLYEQISIEHEQSDFRRLHYSHALNSNVLEYSMDNEIKIIFQYPQIASIIQETFYHTLAPTKSKLTFGSKNEFYYYGRSPLFDPLNDLIVYITAFNEMEGYQKNYMFEVLDTLYNMRYNPSAVFMLDAVSRITVLCLITKILILSKGSGILMGGDSVSIARGYVIAFVFSHFLHECGELISCNWNLYEYFDDWNKLDTVSSILLIMWLSLDRNYVSSPGPGVGAHTVLCLAAIPIALGLLRFISINKSVGQLLIMIREMSSDVLSFFVLYVVCTVGFAITLAGLYSSNFDQSDDDIVANSFNFLPYSFLSLYSATLGNFQFPFEVGGVNSSNNFIETILLIIYLLGSTVMLLNLLIARMSNTHQKINDNSMREWTYLFAKNCKQFSLLKELPAISMLPAPFNIITIAVLPIHEVLIWSTNAKKDNDNDDEYGVSIAGTVADKFYLIIGEFLSIIYFSYIIIKRSPFVWKKIRKGKHFMHLLYLILFPIWLPVFVLIHLIKRFIETGYVEIHKDGTFLGLEAQLLKKDSTTSTPADDILNPLLIDQKFSKTSKDAVKITRIGETNEKKEYINKVRKLFNDKDVERILKSLHVKKSEDNLKDYIDQKFCDLENSLKRQLQFIIDTRASQNVNQQSIDS